MRILPLLIALAFAAVAQSQATEIALPAGCRQLVLVSTAAWNSPRGVLRRFTRERGETRWREIGEAHDVLVGERGLAWGLGLQEIPADASLRKREGDRRAPAGVFSLPTAFGRSTAAQAGVVRFPYLPLTKDTEAVDDPVSRFYNRIVRRRQIARPDWKSSERMAEIPDYQLGIVVAHNPGNVPGAGSCIFIHELRGKRTGTAGCTALSLRDLRELILWLNTDAHPLLVQLPRNELPAQFP